MPGQRAAREISQIPIIVLSGQSRQCMNRDGHIVEKCWKLSAEIIPEISCRHEYNLHVGDDIHECNNGRKYEYSWLY